MQFILPTLLAFTAATSAAVLPREVEEWQISDFSVGSFGGSPTTYRLDITGEGESNVTCSTFNTVTSPTCPDANGPSPFNLTNCGGDVDSHFSWKFSETRSPVANGPPAYFIQFKFQGADSDPIFACSGLFSADNTTCVEGGETLNVPSSFTVSTTSMDECIFA